MSYPRADHDAVWVGTWGRDPGDAEILSYAFANGRTLVTLDKDFGELAVAQGKPHRGIVRLVNFGARQQGSALLYVLETYRQDLEANAILTVEPGRVRVRKMYS